MLCQYYFNKLICSKWILINSNNNLFKKFKPISFLYISSNNKYQNLVLYALTNDGLPYITTCQQCLSSIQDWNNKWSNWIKLTSKPLLSIETSFHDMEQQKFDIIALTNETYSIFNPKNDIPSQFLQIKI